jgi:hypothetical protein
MDEQHTLDLSLDGERAGGGAGAIAVVGKCTRVLPVSRRESRRWHEIKPRRRRANPGGGGAPPAGKLAQMDKRYSACIYHKKHDERDPVRPQSPPITILVTLFLRAFSSADKGTASGSTNRTCAIDVGATRPLQSQSVIRRDRAST